MEDIKQEIVLADFDISFFEEKYLQIQNCG